MKNLVLLALLAVTVVGCGQSDWVTMSDKPSRDWAIMGQTAGSGMVDSRVERDTRLDLVNCIDTAQVLDDWDYFWLYDRNSKLTQWNADLGR